jgi:hypothetical protein
VTAARPEVPISTGLSPRESRLSAEETNASLARLVVHIAVPRDGVPPAGNRLVPSSKCAAMLPSASRGSIRAQEPSGAVASIPSGSRVGYASPARFIFIPSAGKAGALR